MGSKRAKSRGDSNGRPSNSSKIISDGNLYQLLELTSDASNEQIKRAYYRQALAHHPDRHPNHPEPEKVKQRFQAIGQAYEVLSDPIKRRIYDETGRIDGQDSADSASFYQYFDALFRRVSMEELDAFEAYYRGSAEERQDVIRIYEEVGGDLNRLIDTVILGDTSQLQRYLEIIREHYQGNEQNKQQQSLKIIPDERAVKLIKRRRQRRDRSEAKEARELAALLGLRNGNSGKSSNASALIKSKNKDSFDALIAGLEAKYGETEQPKKRKTKRTA